MLSACPRFFDPCVSPRDKRGKVGSGNRGLEIAIRADNGRFRCENFAVKGDGLYEAWLNLKFSAFHEGRGAGKTEPPGSHDLVNGKIVYPLENWL